MYITRPMVLPPDVVIQWVGKLAPTLRRRLGARARGFVITRTGARSASRLLDGGAARLLQRFRAPARVVDVVLDYSRAHDLDPQALLVEAFPVIRDCVNHRLLVPADSTDARRIEPTLERGDRVGRLVIVRNVQVMGDTELYQARDRAGTVVALKLLRPRASGTARASLRREAAVLERLGGDGAPRLIARGRFERRAYLVLSWCLGVSPLVAAAELRGDDAPQARRRLLELCARIVDAYARLHARAVIHGDVYPRNLLVEGTGRITVLDFGLAQSGRGGRWRRSPPRLGVELFLEPECAAAMLAGRRPPPSAAGEQYSVAALLYLLVTGTYYTEFPLGRREVLRRVAEAPVLPFAGRGSAPWPALEAVLARAFAKDPSQRFSSMADFAAALRAVPPEPAGAGSRPVPAFARLTPMRRLLREIQSALRAPNRVLERGLVAAPTCSVNLGAAGIALALYRIACIRQDSGMLSAADAWLTTAEREAAGAAAFTNRAAGVTPETVGRISPYHTETGVSAVRVLISQAVGDTVAMEAAVARFVAASRRPCDCLDLTLGRAGTLLGCALLSDALPTTLGPAADALRALGRETMGTIVRALEHWGPVVECSGFPVLGMAHGWAGLLYATLRWCRSANSAVPHPVVRRLRELARMGEPAGRGMRWRCFLGEGRWDPQPSHVASWCAGTAGFVHLWTLAGASLLGNDFLDVAVRSGWNVWEARQAAPHLCCGLAGRAYALLNLYRHTGEQAWLERARKLGERAALVVAGPAADHDRSLSLYRGKVGVALLAADLERPEGSCMPFFEEEGWPRHDLAL